jgi:hypothetical protein
VSTGLGSGVESPLAHPLVQLPCVIKPPLTEVVSRRNASSLSFAEPILKNN